MVYYLLFITVNIIIIIRKKKNDSKIKNLCHELNIVNRTLYTNVLSPSYTHMTKQIFVHQFQKYAVSFDIRVNSPII